MINPTRFHRSNKYDQDWILANQMGLNSLWLTEWVCQDLNLQPGMRILDLGCGKGLSSIFLAKEYGVQVWATDLWVSASDNWTRIQKAGVTDQVFPMHLDARHLPFADGFFDGVICIDAYIYFGTDDLYLDYIHHFIKPGGFIAIAVPGFMQDFSGPLPEHLKPFWAQECWTWHTVDWWHQLWARTGLVEVQTVDILEGGWKLWVQWKQARLAAGIRDGKDVSSLKSDIQVLETDQGQFMGFIRMNANLPI